MNQIWIGFAIAAFINMIFAAISLATADWMHTNSDITRIISSGLWQYCTNGICTSVSLGNFYISAQQEAVNAERVVV